MICGLDADVEEANAIVQLLAWGHGLAAYGREGLEVMGCGN